MKYSYTSLFQRSYSALTKEEKDEIDRAIKELAAHPFHPFPAKLSVHKLKGVLGTPRENDKKKPSVWEMHATGPIIITFQYGDDEIIFRNCGEHDAVLRTP